MHLSSCCFNNINILYKKKNINVKNLWNKQHKWSVNMNKQIIWNQRKDFSPPAWSSSIQTWSKPNKHSEGGWKLWKLEENPFATFWVTLFTNRRTNPNDYITSAGGCNDTNKTVGDTWHDCLISRSCLTLRQESKVRWTKALNLWGRWFETLNLGPGVRKLVVTCWCLVVYSAEYWPTSMYWFLHL